MNIHICVYITQLFLSPLSSPLLFPLLRFSLLFSLYLSSTLSLPRSYFLSSLISLTPFSRSLAHFPLLISLTPFLSFPFSHSLFVISSFSLPISPSPLLTSSPLLPLYIFSSLSIISFLTLSLFFSNSHNAID